MILLTLAAFAQAPAAVPTTRDAAMTCAAATAIVAGKTTVRVTSHASFFVMHAARADPQGKAFTDRYQELMAQLPQYARTLWQGGAMEGRAPAILQECDRAYPLARDDRPPRLPQDALDRDLMCLGVVSFLEGMGRNLETGGAPAHGDVLAAQQAFIARLPDSRTLSGGLPDQAAVTRRVGDLLGYSADLGNSEAVGRACLAVLSG